MSLDHLRMWGRQVIIRKVDRLIVIKDKGFLIGYDVFGKGYEINSTKSNEVFFQSIVAFKSKTW